MKVVVEVLGGLGNQLFCYAAAYAFARRNNAELILDKSFFEGEVLHGRKLALEHFKIENKYSTHFIKNKEVREIFFRIKRIFFPKSFIVEKDHNFIDKRILADNFMRDVLLQGYWQDEKYFKEFRDELLKILTIKEFPSKREDNINLSDKILSLDSVCLHYRSYSEVKQYDYGEGTLKVSISYYRKCIEKLKEKEKKLTFFIFGDIPSPELERLLEGESIIRVNHNTDYGEEVNDLILMSKSKYLILSNSSYSWWSGWLSNSEGIFFPSRNKLYYYPTPPSSWNITDWSTDD